MNSLNGFLRRLFPHRNRTRNDYSFELLRSTSAKELKKNQRRNTIPRFYSQPEEMPSIAKPPPSSDEVIEVLGEGSQGMPSDQSVLLGFIYNNTDPCDLPSCSSSEFASDDSSLDSAISQTTLIRSHPLFSEGVLLKCVDANPLFPYLHYSLFKGSDRDMRIANIEEVMREMNLRPKCHFGAYDEMYSIHKTTSTPDARLPSQRHAGYIVISFKILEEQTQQESLEKSWLSWSGAREVYKYSPRSWGLRRITLHKTPKRRSRNGRCFAYVMLCEFGSILHPSNRLQAMDMCERLRVRNCGYVSLYQVQWSYSNSPTSPETPRPALRRERNPLLKGLSQEVETTTESPRRRTPKARVRDHSAGYAWEDVMSPVFHSYHHFADVD